MPYARVISVFVAAVAWTTLPGRAAGQRAIDYRASRIASFGSPGFQRLELVGRVPVRPSWRPSELAIAGGFVGALLVDAAQTRRLARGGWRDYTESNPILGPRPSVGQLNTYTAVASLSVLGIAAIAPRRARPWILGAALAVEVVTLAAMSRRGVAIRIP